MPAPSPATRPILADSYFTWESQGRTTLQPSIGSTVAIAATSDWGPVGTGGLYQSEDEFINGTSDARQLPPYGTSDTALHRAVHDAFKGQGIGGNGGAGAVLVYRQATPAAAKATHILQNATPATAITLTAKYPGTRGNALRLTVQASPTIGNKTLLVLDGALVVESYDFVQTDIASLVALVNASSDWFDATLGVDGVALTNVSAVAMTGGNDGTVLTGTEWQATFDALDRERWAIFPAYGLTDPTIRASITAWIKQRNTLGYRCFGIIGGASGETVATANTRSVAINDWNVINLGRGTLHDTLAGRDVSTAEFTARYAGARAWRGEASDDIYVRFADLEILVGPSLTEQTQALAGGTTVFARDTNVDAPVFIREAVTTYTDDSLSTVDDDGVKTHPVSLYKRIKNVAIQHGIELEVGDWFRSGSIAGKLPVNAKTREQCLGRVKIAYSNRETAQVVSPGWTVAIDGPVSDTDDFVAYVHGFLPTRSLRQMFNRARMG